MTTLSSLSRAMVLACGLLLAAGCAARNDNPAASSASAGGAMPAQSAKAGAGTMHFTQGDEYVVLKRPAGQPTPTGRVEIVEVFSYACPHCAEFAPYMDRLRAQLPKGVVVRYMPAVFYPQWAPFAQAFYAARQLGVLKQTHDALFKAQLEHYPLNSLGDLATWYSHRGVNKQKFLAAATNATTMQEMTANQRTEMGWGIDATPTLVVGRRANDDKDAPFVALLRSASIKSYGQLQQLGLWMVKRVRDR
jgi:thiol:disulfide interchange protein DsbA